jgi:hypothetical protein
MTVLRQKELTMNPQRIAPRELIEGDTEEGIGSAVMAKVKQIVCAMHGHDSLLQFEQDRMFLRCVSCGHESPGWSLDETPPKVTARGDARRRVPMRQPLVGIRRVA